jgi:hypothetical protein
MRLGSAQSAHAAIKLFYRIRDKKYATHDVTVKAACNLVWLWQATKRVAELAEGMLRLRGFVHVSTAYVNAHQPKGSHIEEDIYPLRLNSGQTLLHDSLAAELAGLPHAKAERKVRNTLWASAQESFLFPIARALLKQICRVPSFQYSSNASSSQLKMLCHSQLLRQALSAGAATQHGSLAIQHVLAWFCQHANQLLCMFAGAGGAAEGGSSKQLHPDQAHGRVPAGRRARRRTDARRHCAAVCDRQHRIFPAPRVLWQLSWRA